MYCKRCGNELPANGKFCGRCGLAVSVTQEYAAAEHAAPLGDYGAAVANGSQGPGVPQGKPPKSKKRRAGIIAGLSAIAAAAAVIAVAVLVVLPKLEGVSSGTASSGEVVQVSDGLYYTEPSDEHVVTDAETGIEYVDNELVVYAAQGAGEDDVLAAFSEYGAEIVGEAEAILCYQLCLDGAHTASELDEIAEKAQEDGSIESVTKNLAMELSYGAETSDPAWSEGADKTWGLDAIDAPEAWDLVTADSSIHVGFMDGQFYTDHEDLKDAFVETMPYSEGQFDVDGSGQSTHGTWTSGITGAQGNNEYGSAGVAFGCSLYGWSTYGEDSEGNSKITTDIEFDDQGKLTTFMETVGLTYLVDMCDCRVVNMSVFYDEFQIEASNGDLIAQATIIQLGEAFSEMVDALVRAGHDDFVICKITGNSANQGALADWDYLAFADDTARSRILMVGALEQAEDGTLRVWEDDHNASNGGEQVDILAPGAEIYSTSYETSGSSYSSIKSTYKSSSGTSAAAPMVSGVAALVIAANPDLKGDEIKDIIVSTAQGSYTDSEGVSRGCVNAYAAVTRAQDGNELSNYLGETFPYVKMMFPTVEETPINLWDGYLINSWDSYGGYENEEFSFASRSESQTNVDTICLIGESEYALAGISYGQDGEDARSLLEASGWELVYSESTADKHLLNAEWYTKDDQTFYVCFGEEDVNGGAVTCVRLFDGIVPEDDESDEGESASDDLSQYLGKTFDEALADFPDLEEYVGGDNLGYGADSYRFGSNDSQGLDSDGSVDDVIDFVAIEAGCPYTLETISAEDDYESAYDKALERGWTLVDQYGTRSGYMLGKDGKTLWITENTSSGEMAVFLYNYELTADWGTD